MADPAVPTITRPTKESEWTLFAVLLVLCLFALVSLYAIGWGRWAPGADADRIHFLGWIGIGSVICIGLLVAAFASPFLGTVKASGMGASLEVDGNGDGHS